MSGGPEVDIEGNSAFFTILETEFLTGHDECFDRASIRSLKLQYSACIEDPVRCFCTWEPPPHVCLVSS